MPYKYCLLRIFLGLLALLLGFTSWASEFSSKTDVSVRFDARTDKKPRYQYRLRWYPSWRLNDAWSFHAFAVTGDEFSSSYNTFEPNETAYLHFRRLFVRQQSGKQKTEIGILPTYKGRVSSTGLSKDGWITGIRHVQPVGKNNLFEIVVGELDNITQPGHWNGIHDLNYVEFEFSSNLDEFFSFELGLERVLDANFVRGELRYLFDQAELRFELINRLSDEKQKVIAAYSTEVQWSSYPMDLDLYYSYVNEGFGERAELTEDFIEYGHSISMEIGGEFPFGGLDWFSKLERYENQSRFQWGIKRSF